MPTAETCDAAEGLRCLDGAAAAAGGGQRTEDEHCLKVDSTRKNIKYSAPQINLSRLFFYLQPSLKTCRLKKLFFLILISSCAAGKYAAKNAAPSAASITTEDLKQHLTVIASAEMEGRETGTIGQRRAAGYIETQFKAIGLQTPAEQTGYQQFYPLHEDTLLNARLTVNDAPAIYGEEFLINLKANPNANITAGKVVFVGYGIEDALYSDYANADVKGNIVAFFEGEPMDNGKSFLAGDARYSKWFYPGITSKLEVAKAKGAIGALMIRTSKTGFDQRSADRGRSTNMYYPEENDDSQLSVATISLALAKRIIGKNFDAEKYAATAEKAQRYSGAAPVANTKLGLEISKDVRITEASNVIGVIPGKSKKDEYVFVTGHYDHLGVRGDKIYYGADDDGSGTVAVIEMAEAFMKAKAAGKPPKRTMVFMTVSGEEKGLWGSQYYSEHPLYPLDKTSVDLNIDMIGRVDTERTAADTLNYVYVIGHDKLSSDLPVINEAMNKLSSNITLDYKYDDVNDKNRIYYRSDHYNFARKGVPNLIFL